MNVAGELELLYVSSRSMASIEWTAIQLTHPEQTVEGLNFAV